MKRLLMAIVCAALLAACERSPSPQVTDIAGVMPPLEFQMVRASDGAGVTARDYRGKVVVLYFGYTQCPDVCPATLSNLAEMLHRLGARASDVRVLFVSVDPARDTLPVLKAYAAAFAPQVEGLRGSADQIARLARRYRVAYGVTPASPGHPYAVMHSDSVFFFDAVGRARFVATSTDDIAGLARDLRMLLP
jgi:protein SCO1